MDLLSSSQCIIIQLCIQRTMYSFSDYVSMRKKTTPLYTTTTLRYILYIIIITIMYIIFIACKNATTKNGKRKLLSSGDPDITLT